MATKMISGTLILLFGINGAFAMTCSSENFFGRTTYITCPNLPGSNNLYCCGTKENRYCCDTPFGLDKELLDDLSSKAPVALAQVQPIPEVPKTVEDREGVRSTIDRIKVKVNGTVTSAKDKLNPSVVVQKAKDKVKDKVKTKAKEKVTKKLDPTGGRMSLPVIIGVIAAFIIGMIVLCIVCCCCCPFCLLAKRRNQGTVHQRTVANPEAASMMQQPPAQPGYPGVQAYPMQQTQGYAQQAPYPQQGYPQQYPHHSPYPPTQAYPAEQPPAYSEKQAPFNPNYPQ